jgi:heptosyltransferase-3
MREHDQANQSVLLVRPGALGDTILTIPLLSTLMDVSPDATVTFLGTRTYKDIIPPGIEFQPIDHPRSMWLFSEKLHTQPATLPHFDVAYVVLNRPSVVVNNLIATGTERVQTVDSRPLPGTHVVKHLHKGLGLPNPNRSPCLSHLSSEKNLDLVWFHPGSGGPKKCLPLRDMASYAKHVCDRTGWKLVVTIGEDDEFLKADPAWEDLVGYQDDTIVLENYPLKDICERLGRAQFYIGNDSGISHLAAGLGIKSVVFFVSTDPEIWAPWAPADMLSIVDLRTKAEVDMTTLPFFGE